MTDQNQETAQPPVIDPDAALPWDTYVSAQSAASEYARLANTPLSTNDPGLLWATLAVAAQLRAVTYLLGDAVSLYAEKV